VKQPPPHSGKKTVENPGFRRISALLAPVATATARHVAFPEGKIFTSHQDQKG
jgi:hypothetical protein